MAHHFYNMFRSRSKPSEEKVAEINGSTPAEFLSKVSKYTQREFSLILPYAKEITLVEGLYPRGDEVWVADFIILPQSEIRYYPSDTGEKSIGIPASNYMSMIDFSRHIAGRGCPNHANLKTKKIVLEGTAELYEGPGRLPLLKVSEAPIDESIVRKLEKDLDLINRLFKMIDDYIPWFDEVEKYRYRDPYSWSGGDVEEGRERLKRVRRLYEEIIGYPMYIQYTLYETLLGLMQVAKLSIVRVLHPTNISLDEIFSRSILEPKSLKMDPEYEIVFP